MQQPLISDLLKLINNSPSLNKRNHDRDRYLILLYLSVSKRSVIGQFSGPYSTVWPAKI